MVAFDTNVAIALLQGQTHVLDKTGAQLADCVLPVTVAGELLFGAQNSSRQAQNLAVYRSFIYDLKVLLLDTLAAEYYAEIRLTLKRKGRPIPENDMWIAAICHANEAPLLTYDRHFAEVPGLQLLPL